MRMDIDLIRELLLYIEKHDHMRNGIIWVLAACAVAQLVFSWIQISIAKQKREDDFFQIKRELLSRIKTFWGMRFNEWTLRVGHENKKERQLKGLYGTSLIEGDHPKHLKIEVYGDKLREEKITLLNEVNSVFGLKSTRFLSKIPTNWEEDFAVADISPPLPIHIYGRWRGVVTLHFLGQMRVKKLSIIESVRFWRYKRSVWREYNRLEKEIADKGRASQFVK